MSDKFQSTSSGLILPSSAVSSSRGKRPDTNVAYLKPAGGGGPTVAFWTERGLICSENMKSGEHRRYTLETFRPRFQGFIRIVQQMEREADKYRDELDRYRKMLDQMREVIRRAEEFGSLFAPGVAEYHRGCEPVSVSVPSTFKLPSQ